MKKLISVGLAVIMTLLMAACGTKDSNTLVCGVTEYEPMNYRDASGNWTGFDTEFALLVGEKLGMDVEFQLIEWSQKFAELDSGAIDAIWNGFTATAMEADGTLRLDLCDMSYSYMLNTQCIVVRTDRASEFNTAADLAGVTLAAEAGSAGETKAKNLVGDNGNIIPVPAQIHTFMEIQSGAVDGAVVDVILAKQLTGTGDYANLGIAPIDLGDEVYAIGFRKGDDLKDKVNQAMIELYEDGTLMEIARKYGLDERLVLDRTFSSN
jgi:polar amino acid transport system substrate-binding protein